MHKVLVIEDDEVCSELVKMLLERHGCEVILASDGIDGYEAAVRQSPDLIVTDISMPGADGVHVIRRLRDTPGIESTPILVITGYGTGSASFAMSEGATAYEPKPLNAQAFLKTVQGLLA
jgi:CheY-like chemotaxis protein